MTKENSNPTNITEQPIFKLSSKPKGNTNPLRNTTPWVQDPGTMTI